MSDVIGPVDGRVMPRFAGAATFARLPEIDRVTDYDVAVLGVPFDIGTSYRPGARFGPMAVRQASRHLRPGHHVELDCAPNDPVQIMVNDRVIAQGEVVVVGGNYGVRVTKIATREEHPEETSPESDLLQLSEKLR